MNMTVNRIAMKLFIFLLYIHITLCYTVIKKPVPVDGSNNVTTENIANIITTAATDLGFQAPVPLPAPPTDPGQSNPSTPNMSLKSVQEVFSMNSSSKINHLDRINANVVIVGNVTHNKTDEAVEVTVKWAEANYPFIIKLLNISRFISHERLEQIPGAKTFVRILAEVFRAHRLREKSPQNVSEYSVEAIIEKLQPRFATIQVPGMANISERFLQIPGVKTLRDFAIESHAIEVPFVQTLAQLTMNISKEALTDLLAVSMETPINQLHNMSIIKEITSRATKSITTRIDHFMNETRKAMVNHTIDSIANITELGKNEFVGAKQLALNISGHMYDQVSNFTGATSQLARDAITRIANLSEDAKNLVLDHFNEMSNRTWSNIRHLTRNITSDPYGVATHFGESTKNMSINTINRFNNLTQLTRNYYWNNWNDIRNYSENTAKFSVHTFNRIHNSTGAFASHTYYTMVNITDITRKMSPIQIFRHKSVDDLLRRTRADFEDAFGSSLYNRMQSYIPGFNMTSWYNWLNTFFSDVPIKTEGFRKLFNYFDNNTIVGNNTIHSNYNNSAGINSTGINSTGINSTGINSIGNNSIGNNSTGITSTGITSTVSNIIVNNSTDSYSTAINSTFSNTPVNDSTGRLGFVDNSFDKHMDVLINSNNGM